MDPVKASPAPLLDPAEFTSRFAATARAAAFNEEKFGETGSYPLLAYTRQAAGSKPRIYLSAGIHGDEPAPPWALAALLEAGRFDDRASWWLCPLLNPLGFVRGTRENADGIDLNRDYKSPRSGEIQSHVSWLQRQPSFDLCCCIHEDWEATGFYLYELNPLGRPSLAYAMLDAARLHCPIEPATLIDGRDIAEPGIIRPVADPLLRETWPETIYLREHHGTLHYTIESPSGLPRDARVRTLVAVLDAALSKFLGQA